MNASATTMLIPIALTLVVYESSRRLFEHSGRKPILHPILVSVTLLIVVLTITRTSYERYFNGAQLIHFLLGPAVVGLAVPLYRQLDELRLNIDTILPAMATGAMAATASAVGIGWFLGGESLTIAALAPKSATAPVAMAIGQSIGAIPALCAVVAVLTGIVGACLGPLILDRLGIRDPQARGLALGTASHGIGTARAFEEGEQTGTYAGLAMGLTAVALALVLPMLAL